MKTFELKQEDKEFLKLICEQAPEGITIADVRRSIRLIDRIDSSTGPITLDEADHQYLVGRFSAMKFVKADRAVLNLFDRVNEAKEA